MAQTARSSALLRLSKRYTVIAVAAWTVAVAVVAGVWKVYEFQTEQARQLRESIAKQAETVAKRDEARSQATLETIQQAQRLTEWELEPKGETWNKRQGDFGNCVGASWKWWAMLAFGTPRVWSASGSRKPKNSPAATGMIFAGRSSA